MEIILTTSEIASFFDVTRHAVQKWFKAGCPKVRHGKCNLKAVFNWWLDNIAETKISDTETIQELKAEHLREKIKGERLKNEQTEGNLISLDEIKKQWSARVGVVTSGLEAFADRLPPVLEGKSKSEMKQLIKREIRELRDSYARKGKYTPKTN